MVPNVRCELFALMVQTPRFLWPLLLLKCVGEDVFARMTTRGRMSMGSVCVWTIFVLIASSVAKDSDGADRVVRVALER